MSKEEFHRDDYLVFGASLLLSLSIGFFFSWYSRGRASTKEYLQGGGNMNPFAVGLSIAASMMNAVFLIGGPSEIHYFGIVYSLIGVAFFLACVINAIFFLPFYRRNVDISIHQYLGDRFDSMIVRVLASLTFTAAMVLFLAVVLYTPALAFEAVTGLSIHVTQLVCGGVCTLYVVMGGFRAVVWTDTVQMIIVMAGTLTVVIEGANKLKSDDSIWEIARKGDRINFDKDDTDFTETHTVWTQCIGQVFNWLPVLCANQMVVQRFLAVGSTAKAQIAGFFGIFVILLVTGMVAACGLVMYATFKDCDPLADGRVDEVDQLFPLLIMEVLGEYHGLPGLYIAAVFAAALSSVSSAVNSLAAVFLEDFIKPIYARMNPESKEINDQTATWISKGLSLFFGLMSIALSYVAPYMGDEVIEIPSTIWGSVMAPLAGIFILAIFFPCANAVGAVCALLITLTFSMWMTIGGIIDGRDRTPISIGLECDQFIEARMRYEDAVRWAIMNNQSIPAPPVNTPDPTEGTALEDFYSISYSWYGIINLVICVSLGLIISWLADGVYHSYTVRAKRLRGDQVYDMAARCCCCLPHRWWHWLRCNVEHDTWEEPQNGQHLSRAGSDTSNAHTKSGSHSLNEKSNGQVADNIGYVEDETESIDSRDAKTRL